MHSTHAHTDLVLIHTHCTHADLELTPTARTPTCTLTRSPEWLNDKLISFALEMFSRRDFASLKNAVVFVPAPVVQLVSLISDPDEVAALLGALALAEVCNRAVMPHHFC